MKELLPKPTFSDIKYEYTALKEVQKDRVLAYLVTLKRMENKYSRVFFHAFGLFQ